MPYKILIKTYKENTTVKSEASKTFELNYDIDNNLKLWFMDLMMDKKITFEELKYVMMLTNLIHFKTNMELSIDNVIYVGIKKDSKT